MPEETKEQEIQENEMLPFNINDLPDEILLLILNNSDEKELRKNKLVCQKWKQIIEELNKNLLAHAGNKRFIKNLTQYHMQRGTQTKYYCCSTNMALSIMAMMILGGIVGGAISKFNSKHRYHKSFIFLGVFIGFALGVVIGTLLSNLTDIRIPRFFYNKAQEKIKALPTLEEVEPDLEAAEAGQNILEMG